MKLLVDTHIWIWMATNQKRLGKHTSRLLADTRNEVMLSSVSVWEQVQLIRGGKFANVRDPDPWMKRILKALPLQPIGLTHEIAREAGRFELPHRDPYDRLLVATARVLECALVTEDADIIASGCVKVVPND
jgi:PIN domain nuclease of toxin-antitoxin system